MIPKEVVDMAQVIDPDFQDLHDDAREAVIAIAMRLYDAGYLKPETTD